MNVVGREGIFDSCKLKFAVYSIRLDIEGLVYGFVVSIDSYLTK